MELNQATIDYVKAMNGIKDDNIVKEIFKAGQNVKMEDCPDLMTYIQLVQSSMKMKKNELQNKKTSGNKKHKRNKKIYHK